jgi:hypothetical protein
MGGVAPIATDRLPLTEDEFRRIAGHVVPYFL